MMEMREQNFVEENSDVMENIKKKRPNLTKLDIEKLFEQSVELTQIHRKLYEQNKKLKRDLQKVQQSKAQKQQFISQVEKIVKEKSHELTSKNPHQSSWLVYKLHQKIYDLKQEIQVKEKAIRKLNLSRQNQILFRKQIEIECIKEINQFAQTNGLLGNDEASEFDQQFEEIVWMDDFLQSQKQKIVERQGQLEQQERQSKKLLTAIAVKKTQLKKLRQIQREYYTVQENFMQQKKKKEQKMVDNKSYLTNLIKEKDTENQKYLKLKQKRNKIEAQQLAEIKKLEQKLSTLKKIYQANKDSKVLIKQKSDVKIKTESTEEWVKRVTINQVENIGKNLNLCLSLKGVNQQMWIEQFMKDKLYLYTIQQVVNKLKSYPFEMTDEQHIKLLARYVVEDNDIGPLLEDSNTSQDAPIVKSILTKLIGPIKVYTPDQIIYYREELGTKLSKYWSLVEQSVHIKEGVRNLITRQILEQGFISAQLELTPQQIDYAVLFLFSWSRDITKLQLNRLGKLKEQGLQKIS